MAKSVLAAISTYGMMAITVLMFSYNLYAIIERLMDSGYEGLPADEIYYMGCSTIIFLLVWTNCRAGLALLLLVSSACLIATVVKVFRVLKESSLREEDIWAIMMMLLLLIFTVILAIRLSYPEDIDSDDEDGLEEESSSGTG